MVDLGCHIVILPVGQSIFVLEYAVHFHPLFLSLVVITFLRSALPLGVWGPRVLVRKIQVRLIPLMVQL